MTDGSGSELFKHPGTGPTSSRPGGFMRRRILLALILVAALMVSLRLTRPGPSPQLSLIKAVAAHKAGRVDEAQRLYLEVLKIDPENKFARFDLGVIEEARGHPAEAEAYYKKALAGDPKFVPALFNLAVLRAKAGANHEAGDLYQRIIAASPKFARAHLNYGLLLIDELGNRSKGEAELRRAIELDHSLTSRIPPGTLTSPPGEVPASPPQS
jgi:tetratricopeptide (TPR) repeat protein